MPPSAVSASRTSLSLAEARRIALAAQGFDGASRDGRSRWPSVAATVDRMGFLQIDSVNVLVRSHYLPVFSRLGDYDRATLDRHGFTHTTHRTLFEYWAHEACLLPLRFHPLLRWRMARAAAAKRADRAYIARVKREVAERGPVAASDLEDPGERSGPWWGWRKGKAALEHLFRTGEVTSAGRRGFERIYDLTERVLPAATLALPTPAEPDAMRQLALAGAEALGVATAMDIRDYFRLPPKEAARAIAELVEEGAIVPVTVEGWDKTAYLTRDAAQPRRLAASALLSPFDPVVFFRPRAERLFGFHYRIEIYTPEPKRKFGYYVLPYLHRGMLVARIDLKAERGEGVLAARAAHIEAGVDAADVAEGLAAELRRMATWLGLEQVRVSPTGNLSAALMRHFSP